MLEVRKFENSKRAEFEAWLTDSYSFEDIDPHYFVVLNSSEARDRIKSLVSEGKYDIAARYSEALLASPKFTEEERSRSTRVTFSEYAILLDEAFKQGLSLNEVLKKRVLADLEGIMPMAPKSGGTNQEKLSILNKAFTAWKDKPEKESSVATYYTPIYWVADDPPIDALDRTLIDSIIERRPKSMPSETVEAFFRVAGSALTASDFPDAVYVEIRPGEKSGLNIEFSLTTGFIIHGRLDKRLREFDEDVVSKLLLMFDDVDEYEDECYLSVTASILSVNIQLVGGKIFVDGVPITWEKSVQEQKLLSKLTEKFNEERLKSQVLEALEKNDMSTVADLTRRLKTAQRRRDVVIFAVKTIVDIVNRSQVVSFRAPDVVIRAWEAYGNLDLSATPSEKKATEGKD